MIRTKILKCLLSLSALLLINGVFAQGILLLDNWKISNFGSTISTKTSSCIILRQYSPIYYEGICMVAAPVIVTCKWTTPLNYVDMGVTLIFTYQNRDTETIEKNIPKGVSTEQKLVYIPQKASGKKIMKLEIQHGQTAMEVKIFSVEIAGY
ncbi:MAG: hypothetical protein HXX16_11465 [Bacteroidales bacterium]|nr:hypothetical protein [Bacteroidales bacterium]